MAQIFIPTPLRGYADGLTTFETGAESVRDAVQHLVETFPDLRPHLLDGQGQLRSFVNLFLGDEDVRHLQQGDTPMVGDSVLSIVPAIAGGRGAAHVGNFCEY